MMLSRTSCQGETAQEMKWCLGSDALVVHRHFDTDQVLGNGGAHRCRPGEILSTPIIPCKVPMLARSGTCNHRGAVVFIPSSSRRIVGASGGATLSWPGWIHAGRESTCLFATDQPCS